MCELALIARTIVNILLPLTVTKSNIESGLFIFINFITCVCPKYLLSTFKVTGYCLYIGLYKNTLYLAILSNGREKDSRIRNIESNLSVATS